VTQMDGEAREPAPPPRTIGTAALMRRRTRTVLWSASDQLRLQIGPGLERAAVRGGDHPSAMLVVGDVEAVVLARDHARGPARVEVVHQRVGDVVADPLLQGEPPGEAVDQIAEPAEADQLGLG